MYALSCRVFSLLRTLLLTLLLAVGGMPALTAWAADSTDEANPSPQASITRAERAVQAVRRSLDDADAPETLVTLSERAMQAKRDAETAQAALVPLLAQVDARIAQLGPLDDGATEVDMVVNIGKVLGGDWNYVSAEIQAINRLVVENHAILKVIFETDYLQDEHIIRLCQICSEHGAAFVKTSTGFSTGGATAADIALMRKTVGPDMGVKASGGVRTREQAFAMIEAGATRIGCSSTKTIMG